MKKSVLTILIILTANFAFSQETDKVKSRIEAYWHLYEIADTDLVKELQLETLHEYYSSLPTETRKIIRSMLAENVFSADEKGTEDKLLQEIIKYLAIVPVEEPGREVFLLAKAGILADLSDKNGIEGVVKELDEYERITHTKCTDIRRQICKSIDAVLAVERYMDDLTGFWVSGKRHGPFSGPYAIIEVKKQNLKHTTGNTLKLAARISPQSGVFHPTPMHFDYPYYLAGSDYWARVINMDLAKNSVLFKFGSDGTYSGNTALAQGVGNFGGQLGAAVVRQSAGVSSLGSQLGLGLLGNVIALGGMLAADEISAPKLDYDIITITAAQSGKNILHANLNFTRVHVNKNGQVTTVEATPDKKAFNLSNEAVINAVKQKNNINKDEKISLYKIPVNSGIDFIDRSGNVAGPQWSMASKDQRNAWNSSFRKSYQTNRVLRICGICTGALLVAGGAAYSLMPVLKPVNPVNDGSDSDMYRGLITMGVGGVTLCVCVGLNPFKTACKKYNDRSYKKLKDYYGIYE